MAKCDEGYLCRICGKEVSSIVDSDLYLQYVIGWIDPETLHTTPECHIRCNPAVAQFINDERFGECVLLDNEFSKSNLDAGFVADREALIARGYDRLWQLVKLSSRPAVREYPLQEVIAKWSSP